MTGGLKCRWHLPLGSDGEALGATLSMVGGAFAGGVARVHNLVEHSAFVAASPPRNPVGAPAVGHGESTEAGS